MLLLPFLLLGAGLPPDRIPVNAADTITAAELKSGVYFLASEEMQGRDTGSAANQIAALYLAHQFESMGLEPAGDSGYFQYFSLSESELSTPNGLEIRHHSRAAETFVLRQDFFPSRLSASGLTTAPLVFAGYGITAPEYGYDDYAGIEVEDRIALVLTREPGYEDPQSPFDGLVRSKHAEEFQKIKNAQEHGAAGLIIISQGLDDLSRAARSTWPEDAEEGRQTLQVWADQVRIPVVYISEKRASLLLETADREVDEIRNVIDQSLQPQSFALDEVTAAIESRVSRKLTESRNVFAYIPGNDPELKHEVVVLGAHFDHVGIENNQIYRGADDNASGTMGLLEIAEAFALSPVKPRRSVLFAAWNAEERGLLGSHYYVEDPAFPLSQTVAMLQMDMIGRNEEVPDPESPRFRGLERQDAAQNINSVNILGYSRSQDLKQTVSRMNQATGLDLHFRYDNQELNLLRRSDNWPFLKKDIPILFFNTGLHPDYHQPTDTPDKLNYPKMERIVRLVFLTSWEIANSSQTPKFD